MLNKAVFKNQSLSLKMKRIVYKVQYWVPYSGKCSWEKIFTNFVNQRLLAKKFFTKIEHCRCGYWAFNKFFTKSYFEAIRKNFSHENFPLYGTLLYGSETCTTKCTLIR